MDDTESQQNLIRDNWMLLAEIWPSDDDCDDFDDIQIDSNL